MLLGTSPSPSILKTGPQQGPVFASTHLSEQQFTAFDLPELKSARRTLVLARRKQREDLKTMSTRLNTAPTV
jgi:hypothetical protein